MRHLTLLNKNEMNHYSNKTQKRTIKEKNHKVGFKKSKIVFEKT